MKEAVSRKKGAHKVMCRNCTDNNKMRYKSIKIEQREQFQKQRERMMVRCLLI